MRETWRRLIWPGIALVLLLVFNAIVSPSFFHLHFVNGRLAGAMIDVLNQGAPVMLLALGMTLVIGTGGIDLSVGAVMAMAGALAASVLRADGGAGSAIVAALAVCTVAGFWNGLLVTMAGIGPIVATLILMVAGRGIAQLITHGEIITINPDGVFVLVSRGTIVGVPVPIVIVVCAAIVLGCAVRLSAVGMFIESIGGNEEASRHAGIDVRRVRLVVYGLMGLLAGLAGLIDSADIAAADANNSGLYLELDAILAVVIGGTALTGGRFSLVGSLVGAVIIQTLSTTILMAQFGGRSVPVELNLIIKAAVVLIVCLLQSARMRQAVARWWGALT